MRREDLEKVFEQNTEDAALLCDICEFVYPGKGNKYGEELRSALNSPLDAFFNAYANNGIDEEYNMTRLKALLKLIFMINFEKGFINGKKRFSFSIRSSTINELIESIFMHYEMFMFEKMLILHLKKRGNIICVLESSSNEIDRCFISHDDLYPILAANQGETFLLVME